MKKCEYCAKEISYHQQYCDDDCHRRANQYYENCDRFSKLFMGVNVVCVFGIPVGLFFAAFNPPVGVTVATLSCFVLGAMLILLPFPTEGMIKKHKLKKAIKISRIFGGAVIGMGILIIGLLFVLE